MGLLLGGAPGARLSHKLETPVGRNTLLLLRLVRATPRQSLLTPRVLGIDDWAKRKGQAYGTILVDLERGRPIELLPDQEASTLVVWLEAHPGVEIIARDRAGAYADGAASGASGAQQVADRFHRLRNLAEALQAVFERHANLLQGLSGLPCRNFALRPLRAKYNGHATA